jgi:protein-S-isoprenylcysteine O-methyltransferase Ste14
VVEAGPYRFIRHPSYAGSMLVVLGMPLVMDAYLSLILSVVLITLFNLRLRMEEVVLAERLKGYAAYQQRTHRLIPGVW